MTSNDRDLLFGLIALQNNLLDRDALLKALADRSQPLPLTLLQHHQINEPQRQAITLLALEYEKAAHGDAARAFAAFPQAAALGANQSAATLFNASTLSSEPPTASIPAQTPHTLLETQNPLQAPNHLNPNPDDTQPGFGRFRLLRPHAQGGLGSVSVALDAELNREVALKQIRDHFADDPASRRRFLIEAEVTGSLEHPGIVPVYGLGSDDTGRPYYAMRFIRGDSLQDAIRRFHENPKLAANPREQSLELRQLLGRFLNVCNAIEYAHRRGVLHRDIKPQNIVAGRFGETLVVDWGLAKAIGKADPALDEGGLLLQHDTPSGATIPGRAVGTPAYMSPEQARGDLENLGPQSDVYSLGATLFTLLTGKPSVNADSVPNALKIVRDGLIPSPRQINPRVPRGLDAICKKAMAHQPSDRYQSAQALADDLEHWLADEPLDAGHEPPWAQAGRWVRKHLALSGTIAAGTLMGLLGLAAVQAVTTSKNAQLHLKNNQLQNANLQLLAANAQLDQAHRREVAAQRELFLSLYETAGTLFRENLSNSLAIDFYNKALNVLRDLGAEAPNAPLDLRRNLAATYLNLAKAHREAGQTDKSESDLQQATRTIDLMAAKNLDPGPIHALRARVNFERGMLEIGAQRWEPAIKKLKNAVDDWSNVPDQIMLQAPLRRERGLALYHTADVLAQLQQIDPAIELAIQAEAQQSLLLKSQPNDLAARGDLLKTQSLLKSLRQTADPNQPPRIQIRKD
jgi:serine/threonine protein kinase